MTLENLLLVLVVALCGLALVFFALACGPLRSRFRAFFDRLHPERAERREMVADFIKTVPTILDFRLLVDSMLAIVSRAFDCRYACLFLKDEQGDGYRLYACSAPGDTLVTGEMVVLENNPVVHRLRERDEVMSWEIFGSDPVLRHIPEKDTQVFRVLGAQLLASLYLRDELLGFLLLSRRMNAGTYSREDRQLLTSLCFQAAVAIENARLYALARTEAITDGLTGLYNRRFFEEAIEQELARHWRYGHKFALLLFDIDRFKLYNDRKGHLAGDRVLTLLGQILKKELRAVDIAARWGGEEFVILLPETGMEQALAIAERLRTVMETELAPQEDGGEPLTVSIGVAGCPVHGVTREGLLQQADQALYQAKHLGRNLVCIYPVGAAVEQPPGLTHASEGLDRTREFKT